jgi:hypothetical protein
MMMMMMLGAEGARFYRFDGVFRVALSSLLRFSVVLSPPFFL